MLKGLSPKGLVRRLKCALMPAALVVAAGYGAPASAQLELTITRGVASTLPIAVVPFGWQGTAAAAPLDVADVVADNLESSGRFDPMGRSDMIEKPSLPEEINFRDWRLLNVDNVIIGRISEAGPDRYLVRFQVFDVFTGQQLLGYELPSTAAALRATAHRISDMIYEQLTGIPGAFSTRIAYVSVSGSGDDAEHRLVVADADGRNFQSVLDSPEPIMSPAWSPDGRRLAYVSFEGGSSAIYVQDLATGKRREVSSHTGINGAPAWSPDGRWLALTLSRSDGNLDVYVLNPATNDMRRLTRNPAIDTEPVWSPDGESIFFTSDRSGGPQVYRVDVSGGRPKRVTFEGNYNARPRVSPDGKSLAVVHNDRGNYRIAVVTVSDGATRVLSDGQQDESPSFAPNGSVIIYATRRGGRGVLATVAVDGSVSQSLDSAAGDVREPVWSPYPSD